MKICIISDTHGMHRTMVHPIPECDVLIHAGDFTGYNTEREWGDFVSWLLAQPGHSKLLIQGNHDNLQGVEPGPYQGTELHLLHDTYVEIEGLKFYGSPWTPEFYNWHWMLPRDSDEIAAKWAEIPDDVDVLITHGPPKGLLDFNADDDFHCGCERLEKRIRDLRQLKLHCFGHIHAGSGISSTRKFVNAAICDEGYRPWNEPKIIEINA